MSNFRTYSVYLVTCSVNGKIYVGMTKYSAEDRLRHHFKILRITNKNKLTRFGRAILKYGPDNFTVETLLSNLSHSEACEYEISEISSRNATDKTIGYNTALGGKGVILTSESRAKISEALRKRSVLESTKAKMSAAMTGNKLFLGRHHSDETKSKISASIKGKPKTQKSKQKLRETIYKKCGFDMSKSIVVLSEKNPKKISSASFYRFEKYRECKTVADYISGGGSKRDLKFDADRNYIRIEALPREGSQ